MRAYVRGRLAGTEQPPVPAPDPMKSYVLAQGALGSVVPPDTLPDSPRFLEEPDVGTEQTTKIPSSLQLELQRQNDRRAFLLDQLSRMDQGSPQYQAAINELGQLSAQFQATTAPWADRQIGMMKNPATDADVIQQAIQNRQAQPRQPLPPPARGGVPLGAPIAPAPPVTRDLTS